MATKEEPIICKERASFIDPRVKTIRINTEEGVQIESNLFLNATKKIKAALYRYSMFLRIERGYNQDLFNAGNGN